MSVDVDRRSGDRSGPRVKRVNLAIWIGDVDVCAGLVRDGEIGIGTQGVCSVVPLIARYVEISDGAGIFEHSLQDVRADPAEAVAGDRRPSGAVGASVPE